MKLIIGLGNPGKEYEKTRHNVGFLFLDFLKEKLNINEDFENESKFKAHILKTDISGVKTILVKPQTYMNLSGESVVKIMSFYKIDINDIIIIFDDISLEFGKIRFRPSGSSGGQNGVKNIISHIGENFKRIKIGIGLDKKYNLSDWVLSKFNDEELQNLQKNTFNEVYNLLIKNL